MSGQRATVRLFNGRSAIAKKPPAVRKLKVFETSVGFYDTVVAVPSQAAALRAWGTTQNLFKDGVARPAENEKAIAAALDHPGTVLRRAIGTTDRFGLDPGVPKIPDLPPGRKAAFKAPVKERSDKFVRTKEPPPKPADRTALDRAEAELSRLDERRRQEEEAFEERRRDLDAEVAKAAARYEQAIDHARERIDRERKAYREAGGRN